jgi:energy-converting hydrogenase Eha subunit C
MDPEPRGMITKKKRRGTRSYSQTGTAPILSAGQCWSTCSYSLGVRCMQHVGPCMRGVTKECAMTRERTTSPGSSWEVHGPTSVCTICCSLDAWPWASSSVPTYVFQVYVSYASLWMLHMFYMYVVYVSMTIHICCKCVLQIFQLFHVDVACFHLDVAYVAVAIHVCCKSMFQIFHLLYTYVASLCFKYFTCFKRMLQVFYLDVAYVAVIIHIVATYVLIVSPCFSMLQQVLLPTCSDLRASTRFTRRPCMTRRGPSR